DLANCHAMHQCLLSAFPDVPTEHARQHFGVLYRVESTEGGARLLIQSYERPDWSRLPQGYLHEPPLGPKRIDGFYAQITAGQEFVFRLRANPTRRISDRNTTQAQQWRGKCVDVRREEVQIAWLQTKGEHHGFSLVAVRTQGAVADVRTATQATLHGQRSQTGRLSFGTVVFEGRLRVTDPAAFLQALANGIGSGKAYGFGLLSVAAVPRSP